MNKRIKKRVASFVEGRYSKGDDGRDIARALIEQGIRMMWEEGDLGERNRIVPSADGSFHLSTFTTVEPVEDADEITLRDDVLEAAGQQFLFYAVQHMMKGTTEADHKMSVNAKLAHLCFKAIGRPMERRPVELSPRFPAERHLPALADRAWVANYSEEAQGLPVGLDLGLPAPETPGLPAKVSDVTPCRAEIVRWIEMKIPQCTGHAREVLIALRDEIAQHIEERPIDIGAALRQFYADVHARNVKAGWWSDLADGSPKKRSVGELFILFVTELAEAYRAYLSGEDDDKLPQYKGLGVELGDLQIRLADFCGALADGRIVEHSGVRNPGDEMFEQIVEIAYRYEAIRKTPEAVGDPEQGDFLPPADVAVIVLDKLEFNANRPDHKIENRVKEDGKRT